MASVVSQMNKALYFDNDTRREIADCNGIVQRLSRSVACLIPEWHLNKNHNGSYSLKNVKNVSAVVEQNFGYPLTDEAAFRDQACPGTGTAFAVSRNTVLTAGHCAANIFKNKLKVVFNFVVGKENFDANEVYDVKNMMYKNANDEDWGWMQLDRDIACCDPLPIGTAHPENNESVSMLGHPSGISMKYCDGTVQESHNENYFTARLDAFHGNSGSPVFDEDSKAVGILYWGNKDHKKVENYRGTGKTRTEWHHVTQKEIDEKGYERCFRIAKTMFAVARKINQVGLYTINEKLSVSNAHSEILFKSRQDVEDWHEKHKFLSGVLFLLKEKKSMKEWSEHYFAQETCRRSLGSLNYAESDTFNKTDNDRYRIICMSMHPDIINYLRNMVAYQVPQKEAVKIGEFEETFERDFEVPYSRESVQSLLRE